MIVYSQCHSVSNYIYYVMLNSYKTIMATLSKHTVPPAALYHDIHRGRWCHFPCLRSPFDDGYLRVGDTPGVFGRSQSLIYVYIQ